MSSDHRSAKEAASLINDTERSFSLPVPGTKSHPGETRPFRHAKTLHGLRSTPEDGIGTVIDLVRRASAIFGNVDAIGSRTLLGTHSYESANNLAAAGKQRSMLQLSKYSFQSYTEYETLLSGIGRGLVELGLQARKDKLCIYAQTR